jgi:hypothetical protein
MSISAISGGHPPVAYQPPAPVAKPADSDGDHDGSKAKSAGPSPAAASGALDTYA